MKPSALSTKTEDGYVITKDSVAHTIRAVQGVLHPVFTGKISLANVAPISCFEPAPFFCMKDGEMLQLWYERYSDKKQWRPVMTFEQAKAFTHCSEVVDEIPNSG